MVQTFLLFDTITNEKTVKFMQRDIITSTITWHLGPVGSNNFGEYTSFSPCIYFGKIFYGQEPPSGASTTTECGVNGKLLAVTY